MIALVALALATVEAPLPPAPRPQAAQTAPPSNLGGAVQVMADFHAAEVLRGPLEGRWRVTGRRGEGLYLIQLADPDGRADPRATSPAAPSLEGAWRDLQRPLSLDGAGYLAAAKHVGRRLTLLLFEGSVTARTIELRADGRGRWRGDLFADGGRSPVVMTQESSLAAPR